MTLPAVAIADDLDTRARRSLGASGTDIYAMVARACASHATARDCLIDVGCGGGALWRSLDRGFSRYWGLDAVRYDAFPRDGEFWRVDLDGADWPNLPGDGDVVVAVETIEHLENPWAFVRRLAALCRPGGLVIVTTPNQLSVLSLLTLLLKQRFSAFQDAQFPVHKTALLETDLRRAAGAARLDVVEVAYTGRGRMPLCGAHFPRWVSARAPRLFSDNVMVVCRRAA